VKDLLLPEIFLKWAENDPETTQRHSRIQPVAVLREKKNIPISQYLSGRSPLLQ